MNKFFLVIFTILLTSPCYAFAGNERINRFEVEAGVLGTKNMEIHGYKQENATSDWDAIEPTARFEFWSVKKDGWNFGGVLQPLYAHYSDTLTNDLNFKGTVYHAGQHGTLDYQFHSARATANYPVLSSDITGNYLRLGGSVIARYADLNFKTTSDSFHDTNFIVFPLFNIEGEAAITSNHSFFTRADFLPSPSGNVFLDGLFDVFIGVKTHLKSGNSVDAGIRLFFGGYDPNKADEYANKIFFNAAVIRYSW